MIRCPRCVSAEPHIPPPVSRSASSVPNRSARRAALYLEPWLRAWRTVSADGSCSAPPPVASAALSRGAAAVVSGASTRKPAVVMSETAAAAPRRTARPARLRARLVCDSVSSAVAVTASVHLAKAAFLATRLCRSFRSPTGRRHRSSGWPVPASSSEPKRAERPARRVANVSSVVTPPVVVRSSLLRLVSALAPSARRALIFVALVKICRSSSLL